jgi:hypothetical protein
VGSEQTIQPSWGSFTIAEIPGLDGLATGLGIATDTLSGILSIAKTGLQIASPFAAMLQDPVGAAVNAAVQAIETTIHLIIDSLNTGLFYYADGGPFMTGGKPDGLDGWLSRWKGSFKDPGDREKPVFSEEADVSAVILVVGANDLPQFEGLLKSLTALTSFPYTPFPESPAGLSYPDQIESSLPSPPDWKGTKLGDVIPVYGELHGALSTLVGALSIGDDIGALINALARTIEMKMEGLVALVEKLEGIVNTIRNIALATGIYGLALKSSTGIPGLITAARTASNTPPWNHESYVAGVCLLGGTANFAPVAELLGGEGS